jgi:hypothetical protein
MLQARSMIAWTLLMAACALAVGVGLALAAQESVRPKPAGAQKEIADRPGVGLQFEDDYCLQGTPRC